MKAVLRRDRRLVEDDVPTPTPGPGQVLVKTLVCGICGSDLHALHHLEHMVETNLRAGAADTLDPAADIVFGHEFSAEILDHGPGTARTLKAGTRVVSVPMAIGPAGVELVGYSNRFPGGFAEQMLLQEALLMEVPNGLSAEAAAMVEPMAVGEHAVARANPGRESVCLVVGCGPVGLAVIAALKARGLGPVIASDFSESRRRMAEAMGADIVVDPAAQSPHAHWEALDVPATLASFSASRLMGRSIRDAIVFECVGVPGLIQSLIESVPPTARIVIVGVCMEDDRITPVLAINKQLSLDFVFAYSPEEFTATLLRVAEGEIDVAPLISGVVGRSSVAGAFEELARAGGPVKLMVNPALA